MIKILYSLALLFAFQTSFGKILIIDSNFPSFKEGKSEVDFKQCRLISEAEDLKNQMGPCFDLELENKIKSDVADKEILIGMMDFLAGLSTPASLKYSHEKNKDDRAKIKWQKIKEDYILYTHGSRVLSILLKNGIQEKDLILMRMTSSKAALQKIDPKLLENVKTTPNQKNQKCDLQIRSDADFDQVKKGQLRGFVASIDELLKSDREIKIVSVSLGYKLSWLYEDHPFCSPAETEREFRYLKESYQKLFEAHPQVYFVLAAGNENEDFDQDIFRKNDLWASLNELKNLILVGSLKNNGEKFPSSNFGKKVVLIKGEEIKSCSSIGFLSVPMDHSCHETTLRGTSFSTPILASLFYKILHAKNDSKDPVEELKIKVQEFNKQNLALKIPAAR